MSQISIETLKALHIIFVVTWFAGLFYIFRLFIYQTEAQSKDQTAKKILTDQFKLMSWRLWYMITWPSAILTLIIGSSMIFKNPGLFYQSWFQVKLFFILLLYMYQLFGQRTFKRLQNDHYSMSGFTLRLWNEVPTVILISVVFLVKLNTEIKWYWGVIGIMGIAFVLAAVTKRYKKHRIQKEATNEE